jgi:flagellar hook-associated protein 3 FlgL
MQMRVTFQSRAIPLKSAIQQRSEDLLRSQQMVSTGKRILKPSDDPIGVRHALLNRARIAQVDQFMGNIELGRADLNMADSLTGQVYDRILRAKELAVQMGDVIHTAASRSAAALEVDALIDEVVALGNTKFRGRHMFGGENTLESPFVRDGDSVTYAGTDAGVVRRISNDTPLVETTFAGTGLFFQNRSGANATQDGVFNVLIGLKQAMEGDDAEGIASSLAGINEEFDRFVAARTDFGARTERMNQVFDRLEEERFQILDLQSTTEDADLAEAITELQLRQTALQATLSVASNILPTSLMDLLF